MAGQLSRSQTIHAFPKARQLFFTKNTTIHRSKIYVYFLVPTEVQNLTGHLGSHRELFHIRL